MNIFNETFYQALRIGFLGLLVTFFALFVLRVIISLLVRPVAKEDTSPPQAPDVTISQTTAQETLTPESDSDIAVIASVLTAMGVANSGGQIRIEKISG